MQEEVTQKTVTFCIRTTKVTADLLKKGSCCLSASSEAEIGREESEEESAETGKGHGKRAGKTECRDGQYRDHGQKYQVL